VPKKPIRFLLADDNAAVLDGVRALLESEHDLQVVACATDGSDAVLLAGQLRPDVAILDIGMPGMDGIEAARRIRKIVSATRILMLSAHADPAYVIGALQAGALGYVHKPSLGHDLIAAVRTVVAGRRYLSGSLKNPAPVRARNR
jgi:DNA-binding NarL/FixJ family response regulator